MEDVIIVPDHAVRFVHHVECRTLPYAPVCACGIYRLLWERTDEDGVLHVRVDIPTDGASVIMTSHDLPAATLESPRAAWTTLVRVGYTIAALRMAPDTQSFRLTAPKHRE